MEKCSIKSFTLFVIIGVDARLSRGNSVVQPATKIQVIYIMKMILDFFSGFLKKRTKNILFPPLKKNKGSSPSCRRRINVQSYGRPEKLTFLFDNNNR